METKVEFNSDNAIVLEGLLHTGTSDHGVVITHPHPSIKIGIQTV
ncbi:MAG: hypothetical protein ACKVE4_11170 [Dissulfuribacterales bacterium]